MADPPARTDARLEALEARSAHQESSLEELSGVIAAQWAQLDRLSSLVAMLEDRLRDAEAGAGAAAPQAPPPHY